MPLLRIDLVKGRSSEDVKALLDTIHDALVAAFRIPERDRYQIVQEHPLPNRTRTRIGRSEMGVPNFSRASFDTSSRS
jgi:hypothetical protein